MASIKFPPIKSFGIADATCPCILAVTREDNELNIHYYEVGLGEGRTGELKGILEKPVYLAQLLNNIWRNLEGFEFVDGQPYIFQFKTALVLTPMGMQVICYDECEVNAYYPTGVKDDNAKYVNPEERTVTYSLDFNGNGLLEPNSFKRIEWGVMILYKGNNPELKNHAWGITWDDGRSRSYGWVPASDSTAEISDPRYCTKVTDVTHKESSYRDELLRNGVLKKVKRFTTVEIVD